MKAVLLLIIRAYRAILSPYVRSSCCYYPTCSDYSYQAILHHGCFKGLWLTFSRLLRCTPLEKGGYDPVPGLIDDSEGWFDGRVERKSDRLSTVKD